MNPKVVRCYEYEKIIKTLFYCLLDGGIILLTSEEYDPQKTGVPADRVLFRWEGREFQILFKVCCEGQKIENVLMG